MASIIKRPDGRWRARYRDPAGREHARHFDRKIDGQRWLDETTASLVTGQYVDPKAGRETFQDYADAWRAIQVHRPSSAARYEAVLRRYAYPWLGAKPLKSILPSEIQAWVRRLEVGDEKVGQKKLAPSTIAVAHAIVSGVLKSAERDKKIRTNPCASTKLPKVPTARVMPPSTEQVNALHDKMPEQYKAMLTMAVGTGMRQGECFGITLDRIDFLGRTIRVDRQLITVGNDAPVLAPPKTDASYRTIPLPQVVAEALSVHIARFGTGPDGLLFTLDEQPISRIRFFTRIWRPALRAAGLPIDTHYHAMRHYYASLLIRHGESVKTVQARLGHKSATETLDTYSHLWPDSDDRTREAIDSVLLADSSRTGEGVSA